MRNERFNHLQSLHLTRHFTRGEEAGTKSEFSHLSAILPRACEFFVGVRHDVAQFECINRWLYHLESTRHVPAGPYAGVLPLR